MENSLAQSKRNCPLQVAVIGGGAAGFFGAIACAEADSKVQVTLFEAGRSPLTKVRISGGGRCNVTHHCFDPALLAQHYPRGGRALRGPLSRFQPQDTVAWFKRRGVTLKTEADGRMFPVTDDSATIVNCLQYTARTLGVQVKTRAAIAAVKAVPDGFQLQFKGGGKGFCHRLLLATGSHPSGYKLAQALGHTLIEPVPSLFTFNIPEPALHQLAGIAFDPAELKLTLPGEMPLSQTGPLLVTHWGLSGPAVLKLSAWGARALHKARYRGTLTINWLPDLNLEQIRAALMQAKQDWLKRSLSSHCPLPLPKRFWQYQLHRADIPPDLTWGNASKKAISRLAQSLSQATYPISGKGVFKEEFVTCGGVNLREVNFKTLESRCCPGLYFAGEILDIDGVTGGFNFQSAWTTGWLAGQAIAQPLAVQKTVSGRVG
ncbi:MAG: NAD(P)/FAD-dependent oxidoreductase [Cyanobacteria bacterium P01_H01_bin.119]